RPPSRDLAQRPPEPRRRLGGRLFVVLGSKPGGERAQLSVADRLGCAWTPGCGGRAEPSCATWDRISARTAGGWGCMARGSFYRHGVSSPLVLALLWVLKLFHADGSMS